MMKTAISGGGCLVRHFSHAFRYLRMSQSRWEQGDRTYFNWNHMPGKTPYRDLDLAGTGCVRVRRG